MPAPIGPFCFCDTMPRLKPIRKVQYGAVCALILTCAAASGSTRRQDASSGAANAGASATTPTHHRTAPSSAATKKSAATHPTGTKRPSRRKKAVRVRGQQKIDSDRAREIQEALIREHYLSGDPIGTWNEASEDAMRRYQGDHGWQTKEVPDSRALIKLGLGPSKDHLLNPESAMTTGPDAPRSDSPAPTSNTAPPVSNTSAPTPAQSDPPSPQ